MFTFEDVESAEIDRRAAVYGPLADAVRELVDATIRSTAAEPEIRAAEAAIRAVTARLRRDQLPGSFGISYNSSGDSMPWGNAAIGLRNAIAPPLEIEPDPGGGYRCDVVLGAAYEGPPGHVHGGVCALVLDHIAGVAASDGVRATSTGTLTLRYRRGTPLGPLCARARAERTEGLKTFVTATLGDADGVTVEAEGIFVVPSWAR
ncbi:PaaI family thioesterase [Nocardia jiangsuensis]|uniref:Acyl-coenzyme A thioesterase THEM4 n=1 Tax=Nocardia jiangsuensis TaxID=1691563 RepID=A0ABV8DZ98_9NOCA